VVVIHGIYSISRSDWSKIFYNFRLWENEMSPITQSQFTGTMGLSSDQILQIARVDAEHAYRDFSGYRISLALQADGWHVDYELMNPDLNGGGPQYIIDPMSGAIRSKRYEQ
jgi:hypothetical protein